MQPTRDLAGIGLPDFQAYWILFLLIHRVMLFTNIFLTLHNGIINFPVNAIKNEHVETKFCSISREREKQSQMSSEWVRTGCVSRGFEGIEWNMGICVLMCSRECVNQCPRELKRILGIWLRLVIENMWSRTLVSRSWCPCNLYRVREPRPQYV